MDNDDLRIKKAFVASRDEITPLTLINFTCPAA